MTTNAGSRADQRIENERELLSCKVVCPVCGGKLLEIRAKLQCSVCHTICETCCEGGRG